MKAMAVGVGGTSASVVTLIQSDVSLKEESVEQFIRAIGTIPTWALPGTKNVLSQLSVIQLELVRTIFLEEETLEAAAGFNGVSPKMAKREVRNALALLCSERGKISELCELVRKARINGW